MNDEVRAMFVAGMSSEILWTLQLQLNRVRRKEPEDSDFPLRPFVDLGLFITELWRFRSVVKRARKITRLTSIVDAEITKFDTSVPHLKKLRDIHEHTDAYVTGDSDAHDKSVPPGRVRVGEWNDPMFSWLGYELNVNTAIVAARSLFFAYRKAERESGLITNPNTDVID